LEFSCDGRGAIDSAAISYSGACGGEAVSEAVSEAASGAPIISVAPFEWRHSGAEHSTAEPSRGGAERSKHWWAVICCAGRSILPSTRK